LLGVYKPKKGRVMGGNKGKVRPIDGTTWLEACRSEVAWGKPHQWRLDDLFLIKVRLHTFFMCSERNQVPGKILKWIKEERTRWKKGFFSGRLIEEIGRELVAQEIRVYQLLLSAEEYENVTAHLPLPTSETDWKPHLVKEFLVNLREAFSTLPDQEKRLASPIGRKLLAGSQKNEGESWKSSAIVSAYILKVYGLFIQFYTVSGRGWNIHRAKTAGGQFPMALLKDIVEFFQTEFSPWLDDLTIRAVISRIDYGLKHKVQQIETPPPQAGIRPIGVMKITIPPHAPNKKREEER
jgi:hypothetical protein